MDLRRRLSTKSASANSPIFYGIEGSKVVLNALERTKTEEDIAFLGPLADNATSILNSMREVHDGEVDDDLAGLALDACGIVFILINECYRSLREGKQIPDRLKWGSDELAEYLRDDTHPLVQKKISRGFLKRHLRHAADDEKVAKSREKLRNWLVKLGIQNDISIHDKVEAIISEKVSRKDESAQAKKPNERRQSKAQSRKLTSSSTNSGKASVTTKKVEKALPEIVVSDLPDDEGKIKVDHSQVAKEIPKSIPFSTADEPELRKKRKEEERLAKKAERERWRKSEQEFKQLPMQDSYPTTVSDPRRSGDLPRPVATSSSSQARRAVQSWTPGTPMPALVYDESKDLELAFQLQAQLARELEEEDEKKAMEIRMQLHRQWEAEEREGSLVESSDCNTEPRQHAPGSLEDANAGSQLRPETRDALSMIQANRRQSSRSSVVPTPDISRSPSPGGISHSNAGHVSN